MPTLHVTLAGTEVSTGNVRYRTSPSTNLIEGFTVIVYVPEAPFVVLPADALIELKDGTVAIVTVTPVLAVSIAHPCES